MMKITEIVKRVIELQINLNIKNNQLKRKEQECEELKKNYCNNSFYKEVLQEQLDNKTRKNQELERKLDIAIKALEMICVYCETDYCYCGRACANCNSHYEARDALGELL